MSHPCSSCPSLSLPTLFSSHPSSGITHAPLSADLQRTFADLSSSSRCPKCHFLVSLLQMNISTPWRVAPLDPSTALCLRAFSIQSFLPDRSFDAGTVLGVVPLLPARDSRPFGWPNLDYTGRLRRTGCIARSVEPGVEVPFRYRKIESEEVDVGVVKGWLEHCKVHHADTCGDDEVAEPIPFFRLIDCRSRSVVELDPIPKYLALSYVWGPPTPGDKFDEDTAGFLRTVPGVIEDAIKMTLKLGYTYLWVDRYCIYQNDIEKKMQQISTMDLVYQCAQVTLIAVCNDLALGLPGAGRTSRTPQPVFEDEGQVFLCTLPDPLDEIKSSTWMTRGWTFQEALYSRRRLFFTAHQVYLECHTLTYHEVISESEDAMIERSRQDKTHRVFPQQAIGDSLRTKPWTILSRIDEYTHRNLTYESDTLNGILSVFRPRRDVQGHQRYLTHLWGVPILQFADKDVSADEGLVQGLCWRMTANATRRPKFPSWSWTGWKGSVLGYVKDYEVGFKPPYDVDVAVELVDGKVVDLRTYENLLATVESTAPAPTLSPILHVDAMAIKVRAHYKKRHGFDDKWIVMLAQGEEIYECGIELLTGDRNPSDAHLDDPLHDTFLEGIIIGNVDSPTQTAESTHLAPLLIVVAEDPVCGIYERIGLVDFDNVGTLLTMDQREGMRRSDRTLDLAPIFQSRRRKKFRLR